MAIDFSNITKEHIEIAINNYIANSETVPDNRSEYFIVYNGLEIPSKKILREAYKLVYGKEPDKKLYNGGIAKNGAHTVLTKFGYEGIYHSKKGKNKSDKINNIWLFPADKDNYNVDLEFSRNDFISWHKVNNTKNIKRNDIVYIYLSTPIQEIHWRCVVGEPHYYIAGDDEEAEKERSLNETKKFWNGPFVELIPEYEFELPELLSYKELRNHGLKSRLMGPQRLDSETYQYICEVENIDMVDEEREKYINNIPKDKLRELAVKRSTNSVKVKYLKTKTYSRDSIIAKEAKDRANGICQLCEKPAPFLDKHGEPFLQTHHIRWLSRGGSDSIDNTIALCPNCHQRMHILDDQNDVQFLLDKLSFK